MRSTSYPPTLHDAINDLHNLVGLTGQAFVMCNNDKGLSVVCTQIPHKLVQTLGTCCIKITRRLVGKDDLRRVHEGPCDSDPLLLSSRKLGGFVVKLVPEAHGLKP